MKFQVFPQENSLIFFQVVNVRPALMSRAIHPRETLEREIINKKKPQETAVDSVAQPGFLAIGLAFDSAPGTGVGHRSHRHALAQFENPVALAKTFAAGGELIR